MAYRILLLRDRIVLYGQIEPLCVVVCSPVKISMLVEPKKVLDLNI